MLELYKI